MEANLKYYLWRFLEPRFWWVRHFLFWCYNYSTLVLTTLGIEKLNEFSKIPTPVEAVSDFAFVYINLYILIPYFAKRKKMGIYIISTIALIIAYMLFNYFYFKAYGSTDDENIILIIFREFVVAFEFYTLSTGLLFVVEYLYSYEKNIEKERQNRQIELAYLKNQINPHFLFNTLNNIATLSEVYPERVTSVVIELSNVMRYQLYESEKESVLLTNEIENLRQNLNLEVMRLNDSKAEIRVEGNPNGIKVAPLLFLPFLENALKHSADPSGKSIIEVLFVIKEGSIVFTSNNSKPRIKAKQVAGGLGLKNIVRRLEILYPNRHTLSIENLDSEYKVRLEVKV